MKSLILPQYIRYLKVLAAGIALSASFVSLPTNKATAHHTQKSQQKVIEKVKQLKNSNKRWIQVDLSEQRLITWEGNKPVFGVIVSTGKKILLPPLVYLMFIQN